MTPAYKAPKLEALALGCNQGACNVGALLRSFPEALAELDPFEVKDHPAVRFIIGHLAYLTDQAAGPTLQACDDYVSWRDATRPAAVPA